MKRTISIKTIKEEAEKYGISSWSVKDNSVRGIKTVSTSQVKIGDKVVINNYFTLVTE